MESNGLVSLVQKWNRIKFRCHRFPLWWWYFTGVQKKKVVAKSWLLVISKPLDKTNSWTIYRSTVLSTGAPQKLKRAAQSWEVRVISPSLGTNNNQSVVRFPNPLAPDIQIHVSWGTWLPISGNHLLPPPIPTIPQLFLLFFPILLPINPIIINTHYAVTSSNRH